MLTRCILACVDKCNNGIEAVSEANHFNRIGMYICLRNFEVGLFWRHQVIVIIGPKTVTIHNFALNL